MSAKLGSGKLGSLILGTLDEDSGSFGFGQARAFIQKLAGYGQAQAYITKTSQFGQAQAFIDKLKGLGQAQAKINAFNVTKFGQAQARVARIAILNGEAVTEGVDGTDLSWSIAATAGNLILIFIANGPNLAPTGWFQVNSQDNYGVIGKISTGGETSVHVNGTGFGGLHDSYKVELAGASSTVSSGTWRFENSQNVTPIVANSVTPIFNGIPSILFGFFTKHHTGADQVWTGAGSGTFVYKNDAQFAMQVALTQQELLNPSGSYAPTVTYSYDEPLWKAVAVIVAAVITPTKVSGQAQAYITGGANAFGQSQAFIRKSAGYGQAQSNIKVIGANRCAQAQANISYKGTGVGQAQALLDSSIKNVYGQARAQIIRFKAIVSGQSRANIIRLTRAYAQAQAILSQSFGFGQAQAIITQAYVATGQAKAQIIKSWQFGQAQAQINAFGTVRTGQARAFVSKPYGTGQAQATIIKVWRAHGQARATILVTGRVKCGQAQAYIYFTWGHGQAQAFVGHFQSGQAQARIIAFDVPRTGLAVAYIGSGKYIVNFNGKFLPGYAQSEDYISNMIIVKKYAAHYEPGLSNYLGLTNKPINLKMKVVADTHSELKAQVQEAATILRSSRDFEKLYIQRPDRYYLVQTKSITTGKSVHDPTRTLDYEIEFEAKPFLIDSTIHTASGTSLITVTRTLLNGGWTPATLQLTGTNITVSGYSAQERSTGFISVSGAVTDLIINSDAYTTRMGGVNSNNVMRYPDYRLYLAPDTTYISITGATECVISYQDRFYL